MKYISLFKSYAMYFVLFAIIVVFSVATPVFLQVSNVINVVRQISMLGIASVGMTFVLLVGGIDLSIGSLITIINVVCAWLMVECGINPWLSCLISLVLTTFIGFLNGLLIAKIKMPPLIVTLASMTILQGAAYMITGGMPIFGFPKGFTILGQGYVGIIPIPVIIMVIIFIVGALILNRTYFGRYFYAVGGNEEASRLSGLNVEGIKYLVYTLSGLLAGIAGLVMLSRTNSAQPVAGEGYEFDALTANVLGGVSITGGSGKMSNVVAGVLILGVLSNGLILLNVDTYVQKVIKGIVLIIAVGFDCMQKNRKIKQTKVA